MISSKIIFFLAYVLVGSYIPFLNAFMISIGLTATQAGFITGMRNLFYFAGVLWSVIADYTGYRKLIFNLELAFAVLLFSPIPLVAEYVCPASNQIMANHLNITTNFTSTVQVKSKDCQSTLHLAVMTMIFAGSMFDQAVLSFIDSMVIKKVNSCKKPTAFGYQRLFGSIGFGTASLIVSLAIEYNNTKLLPKYGPANLTIMIAAIILVPFTWKLLGEVKWKNGPDIPKYSFPKTMKFIIKSPDIMLFLFSVLIMGVGCSLVNGFLYPFMVNEIKASNTLAGLSLTLNFMSEFVMFAFAKYLIEILNGPKNCIIVGSVSFFIRFLCMSYAYNVYLVMALQMFHAFGFALYWAAAVETVNLFSPKEGLMTMMSILTTTQFGIGDLIANVGGGFLYDRLNGRLMFRYISFIFAGLAVLLTLVETIKKRCKSNCSKSKSAPNQMDLLGR